MGTLAHLNTWLRQRPFESLSLLIASMMCAGCSWLVNGQQQPGGTEGEGNTMQWSFCFDLSWPCHDWQLHAIYMSKQGSH